MLGTTSSGHLNHCTLISLPYQVNPKILEEENTMKTTIRLGWEYLVMMLSTLLAADKPNAKANLFAYLDKAIDDDAAELHDGNRDVVLKAFKNNCVFDKRSRLKKALADNAYVSNVQIKRTLLVMLEEYCDLHVANQRVATAKSVVHVEAGKSRWQLTMDEIDAIDASDFKALDSVYQNMMSKKSKDPDAVEAVADFATRLAHISALRSAARAAAKTPSPVIPAISDSLRAKLDSGKKSLTNAELAELRKLLG